MNPIEVQFNTAMKAHGTDVMKTCVPIVEAR